jgi:sulfur transfer protein SufE
MIGCWQWQCTSQYFMEQRGRFHENLRDLLAVRDIIIHRGLIAILTQVVWYEGLLPTQIQSLRGVFDSQHG